MAKLASVIDVTRVGQHATFTIDGEDFPFLISEDLDVDLDLYGMPTVPVRIYADRVTLNNQMHTVQLSDQ
ncbi:hypothetical protein [Streptomyces sp. NPDC007063]|uniref:hypothetical protein n=1 Tax=Streptomyces sp. NPDC007063 TaxID=3364772 RepID=UPI0036A6B98F